MAVEATDPKMFASWEEAFNYPIPTVRAMEKQLRRDIDSNREKLRTLVGASYRDLLGTAESIMSMNDQMHDVEAYLDGVGQRCNTRLLEKKWKNMQSWNDNMEAPNSARYTFASQLAILKSCPGVISRLLKKEGSVLHAAKVLVISRLLHTKLSQTPKPSKYLDGLRIKLGSLRRKILTRIDRHFQSPELGRDALVEAMCAFSLATSSSSKDVLRHFYHVRHMAISEGLQSQGSRHDTMLDALKLYVKTSSDTQAIVPVHLMRGMEKLKSISLFKDDDVYLLEELNLDLHERWVEKDIKSFIPYIRLDDLPKGEAERLLGSWATEAFSSFLKGLRSSIDKVQDPGAIVDLRRQVIELWLSKSRHMVGIDFAEPLDGLRDAFSHQLTHITKIRASKLQDVESCVRSAIQAWQPGVSDLLPSLWDRLPAMDSSTGGKQLRESLTARCYGETGPLTKFSREYQAFLKGIDSIEEAIKSLKETHWIDDVVEDVDDDDDDLLDNKQVLLAEDDPRLLQEELNGALSNAYEKLEQGFHVMQGLHDDDARLQKSCFLLRIWRELRQHLPLSYQNLKLGLESIPDLQAKVAEECLHLPLQRYSKRVNKATKAGTLTARPLWEGDPELPVLPAQWTFRLLLDIAASMTQVGSDIWSPQATETLKRQLCARVAPLLESHRHAEEDVESHVNGHSNGEIAAEKDDEEATKPEEPNDPPRSQIDSDNPETSTSTSNPSDAPTHDTLPNGTSSPNSLNPKQRSKDLKIQSLFDISYLINAATTKNQNKSNDANEFNELVTLQDSILEALDLEQASVERIQRDAGEYWKRTGLLFGLLG